MSDNKLVVIICPDLGSPGAVPTVALRHGEMLAEYFRVLLVSNTLPARISKRLQARQVTSKHYPWLRRYAHVPNILSTNRALRSEVSALIRDERQVLLWCHGHVTADFHSRLAQRAGVSMALTVQRDISDLLPGMYHWTLTKLYRYATPRAYRAVDTIHSVTDALSEDILTWGDFRDRITVIPNGIERLDSSLTNLRREPGAPLHLIYVGRLSKEKGVPVLLEALARASGPAANTRLTLVGDGPLLHKLKRQANETGIDDRVEFLGWLGTDQLPAVYASADGMCLPSLSESQGIVVLEAFRFGLPVIGSRVGGIPSMIRHGKNGWLVSPGDDVALAQAIESWAIDPVRRQRMGEAGRRTAEGYYWENLAPRFIEFAEKTFALEKNVRKNM